MNTPGRAVPLRLCLLISAACLCLGVAAGTQIPRLRVRYGAAKRTIVFAGPHTSTLVGRVQYPRGRPGRKHQGILFVHGTLPRGKDTRLYEALFDELVARGYLVFAIDLRGFGESAKVSRHRVPEDLDFAADVRAALDYMAKKLPVDRENITLAGHSLGGSLSFAVGATSPLVRNIVSISPGNYQPPDRYSERVKLQYASKLERVLGKPVPLSHWEKLVSPLYLFQYLPITPPKNVYLILADGDWPDVRQYAERLYEEVNTEKGLVIISHSNHNFGAEYDEGNEMIDTRPALTLADEIDTLLKS